MPKKKVGQFEDYKKWTTDAGYTFLAENIEDAKSYVEVTGGDLDKIKEVIDE